MQLAPVMSEPTSRSLAWRPQPSNLSATPAPGHIRLEAHAGRAAALVRGAGVTGEPPDSPAWRAFRAYAWSILDMPGGQWVEFDSTKPSELHIGFAAPELAQVAHHALNDAVNGVQLVLHAPDGPLPPPPAGSRGNWWDAPGTICSAIAAVRGVVAAQAGSRITVMYADTAARIAALEPLFRHEVAPNAYIMWDVWPQPAPASTR